MLSRRKKMTWISIGKVADLYGVSTQAVRNWTREGKLETIRTLGGHRRYKLEKIEENLGIRSDNKVTVLYSRVSAHDQKEDLVRQSEELRDYSRVQKIEKTQEISEIGSGLNYGKKGLMTLIELILKDKVKKIVVSYKDRMMRFGNEIIEKICALKNVEIVV